MIIFTFVVERYKKYICNFFSIKSILQDSQYLIPEEHMLIRDISNDPNQQLIQDYMSVLTGGRTVRISYIS